MSTVMSQQPPKEDGEEEDEEQGEEFTFEDSTDEEKLQEDSKGISSDSQLSKMEVKNTDSTQRLQTSPPAGQEGIPTKDVASVSTAGNTFSGLLFPFKLVLNQCWWVTCRDDGALDQMNLDSLLK